ncbi:hypothetical protein ACOSQ2_025060 [Xanthoceras sorbifolium]
MAGSLELPDVDEVLRRLKERKEKAAAKKVGPAAVEVEKIKTPSPPPFAGRVKGKVKLPSVHQKRLRDDFASEGQPSVALSFPVDASAYYNFGAILPKRLSRSSPNCRSSRLRRKLRKLMRSFDLRLMLIMLVQVLSSP